MKKIYLEGGKICTSHGVKGLVKVEHLCDSPKVLTSAKKIYFKERDGSFTERKIISASVMAQFVLMSIEGINSREEAIGYRGRLIYLHRDDIPMKKGTVLIADMIGLPVIDVDTGRVYGELSEVNDGVQGKLYTVKTSTGDVILPGVGDFIKEIDTERGMFVRVIPGFFSEV